MIYRMILFFVKLKNLEQHADSVVQPSSHRKWSLAYIET